MDGIGLLQTTSYLRHQAPRICTHLSELETTGYLFLLRILRAQASSLDTKYLDRYAWF